MRKREVKAVLFDLDGVLVDSLDAWFHVFNDTLQYFGLKTLSKKEFIKDFGAPIEQDVKKYFKGKTKQKIKLGLINKSGKIEDIPPNARVAVKSKYRKTSERFVNEVLAQDGVKPEVTLYHGDLESAVARGLHDCCIDIVYSGSTVSHYSLKVAHAIKPSDLVFVSAKKV